MSFTEDLLSTLTTLSDYSRLWARVRGSGKIYGRPKSDSVDSISYKTFWKTLSRLEQRGLVENKGNQWKITSLGLDYLKKLQRKKKLPKHSAKSLSSKPKRMIIIFDIPEKFRRERAWLRFELTNLGFVMLQKSVWFGPAPLPKEFIKSLKELKILPYLKFFKATEEEIV